MKAILKKTFFYDWYKSLRAWKNSIRTHIIHKRKESVIHDYGRKFGLSVLIETGTYQGEMVAAMKRYFKEIYSIEISPSLAAEAKKRFKSSPDIRIVEGDSGRTLPNILKDLQVPALFWLDGHYSRGITAKGEHNTPIKAEIDAIFAHYVPGSVILIDDARCFDGTSDYPTLDELKSLIIEKNPALIFQVASDIVRIHS